jgi:hypothetical protein
MSQKSIILIVTLFVLLVAGMFIFAHLKNAEQVNETATSTPTVVVEVLYPNITRIDAKHYFIDGTHTLVGEIEMPTPCDLVEAKATVAESMPEQVMVDFTVINNAETCIQQVTPYRFRVDFVASNEALIKARFMGRDIQLNLIPAGAGETPEEFELFYKG